MVYLLVREYMVNEFNNRMNEAARDGFTLCDHGFTVKDDGAFVALMEREPQ